MSSEEKDAYLGAEQSAPRPRRTPVATAGGEEVAPSEEAPQGRRKRVRITTSEEPALNRTEGLATRRFGSRMPVRSGYTAHEDSATQPGEYRSPRPRPEAQQSDKRAEYAERYQAQRSEGNFGYNYNRSERPQRPTGNGKPAGAKAGKPFKAKKASNKHQYAPPAEPVKYKEVLAPDKEIRLNKFIANSGICSRREADNLIVSGQIYVNGEVITELGRRVTPLDVVEYQGKRIETESKVYVLLNKPKNCVTTSDDPECRTTVMDLVKNACSERIYPVGRLDRHTTGVLLITNDGDLASKLTHPSFMKKKIYHVWLDKPVAMEDMQRIADGIELEDGEIHADALSYVKEDDLSQVGIEIHSGRNRIVRRIFEHLGYKVIKLDRVYFAGLTKKNLPRGRWRYLNEQEVNNLRMGAFE